MTEVFDPDISVYTRNISRITPGVIASISYYPNRGKHGEKSRSGEITSVETLNDGRTRFVFADKTRDREIEVTIGDSVGQSNVRSRKDEKWTTLGKLLRVEVGDVGDELDDLMVKTTNEAFEGRYSSIVAVAAVKWNERILDWFEWSSRHA